MHFFSPRRVSNKERRRDARLGRFPQASRVLRLVFVSLAQRCPRETLSSVWLVFVAIGGASATHNLLLLWHSVMEFDALCYPPNACRTHKVEPALETKPLAQSGPRFKACAVQTVRSECLAVFSIFGTAHMSYLQLLKGTHPPGHADANT